jgi:hypothetical protein
MHAMNTMEFAALLAQLAQRPVPPIVGRHVYLWHGDLVDLRRLPAAGLAVELDLYTLAAGLPRMPFALDEARRLLQAGIASWLGEHAPGPGIHQVVVVTGNSLLQRYRVTLDAFFQASTEARLVVFVVSRRETDFKPVHPMPAYVELEPSATFEFLRSKLGDHALIGEMNP